MKIERDERGLRCLSMSSSNDNIETLTKISAEYTQEQDGCSDLNCPNVLEITTEPDGYMVIKTDRWAFSDLEELTDVIKDFMARFKFGSDFDTKTESNESDM